MATLIGPGIRFLHMPKTGGSWATKAMLGAGVPVDRPAHIPFHGGLSDSDEYSELFTFSCVRHPLDFWRSYWGYRVRTGWSEEHPIDAVAGSSDLNTFAERLAEFAPGSAGVLYEQYLGAPDHEIDFVCRQERLAEDVSLALRLAGVRFDEKALRAYPAINATDYSVRPSLFSRHAAELLAASEADAIDRFYPWEPVPQSLVDEPMPEQAPPMQVRRLEQAELSLRDARAELAALRRQRRIGGQRVREVEARLRSTELSLRELRESRLLRASRPVRMAWYRLRTTHVPSGSADRV